MDAIQIVYNDGSLGFVDPQELSSLIASESIVKFQRGDSWAYPGLDPTRADSSNLMSWGRRRTDPVLLVS